MAVAGLCLAGAAKSVKPNSKDFTEPTHLGKVHVTLDVRRLEGRRQLTGVHISVNGQALAWPKDLELRLPGPGIRQMELTSIATYTCVEDGAQADTMTCPDISQIPVMLFIPFGDHANREEVRGEPCTYSWLFVSFLAERIDEISRSDCPAGGAKEVDEHILFDAD